MHDTRIDLRPGLCLAVVHFAFVASAAAAPARVVHVDAARFKELVDARPGILLDVRTPDEVARMHLKDASVIDFNAPRFEQKAALLDRKQPIFVYCASGNRSAKAAELMISKLGFTEVFTLDGGIRGWVAAGYDVERGAATRDDSANVLDPTAFDALLAGQKRVLVSFQTPWCTPCKAMAPIVDALAEKWKSRAAIVRVDIDRSESLAARERVEGVPVLVLYENGKEVWRHSGLISREALEARLAGKK